MKYRKIYVGAVLALSFLTSCSSKDESVLDQFIENQKVSHVSYGFTGYNGTKYDYAISRTDTGYAYTEKTDKKQSSAGVCKYFLKTPGDEGVDYTLSNCSGTDPILTVAVIPRNS